MDIIMEEIMNVLESIDSITGEMPAEDESALDT